MPVIRGIKHPAPPSRSVRTTLLGGTVTTLRCATDSEGCLSRPLRPKDQQSGPL